MNVDGTERNGGAPRPVSQLRLYVAGQAPNSVRAIANLEDLRREFGQERFDLEIVDVLAEPLRALQDRVLVTPTLVKLSPLPVIYIVGDLSRHYEVVHALGLDPADSTRHSADSPAGPH